MLPVVFCTLWTAGGAALAQDTGGVGQTTTSSETVSKNKVPVAKELLKIRLPRPKSFKLSNGLTVYVLEDHRKPAVRFQLRMVAGSLFQPKPGVAEMTAAMMTEGTQSSSSQQLADKLENLGANVNVASGTDTATLSASGLSESLEPILALMTDVLLHPSFPTDRLDRMKFQQTSGIAQRRTNPTALTAELASKVYYGGTPYAQAPAKANEIAAVTREDLVAFHDAYYRPNGAIMGVSGDVNPSTLRTKLESALICIAWTGDCKALAPDEQSITT